MAPSILIPDSPADYESNKQSDKSRNYRINDLHDKLSPLSTYPSCSLNFLRDLPSHCSSHSTPEVTPSLHSLTVTIIGAGLCGLATAISLSLRGHVVRVLEQASALGEVGAGIQIPPNSSRLLVSLGISPHLSSKVVAPAAINLKRWEDGNLIGKTDLGKNYVADFGAEYWVVHRAHYLEAMYKRAMEVGVEVKLGKRVVEYAEDRGEVVCVDGERIKADLVVAADGMFDMQK